MQGLSSKLSYKGVSLLPLLVFIPLAILSASDHWAYDEALSYVNVIHLSPQQLIQYDEFKLANHHILNSLYMNLLASAGIKGLFFYRLPSLLAFFVYYLFIGRLLKQQKGYQLNHIDQLLLFLWPYSIYFAQARGYGVAMVSFVGALYYFKEYLKGAELKHLLYFILLSCLSSVSIFSFIFPFAAMVIILGLKRFREIITSPARIVIIAICIPVLIYVADKGQIVSANDPSIIGKESLFRGGTISSLISFLSLMDFAPDKYFYIFKWLITLTMLPVLFLMIKRGKLSVEITIVLVTLLLLVFSHYAMGALYPVYRGVAYMILLLLLSFVYANFKRNIFFSLHFMVLIAVGCFYIGYLFYFKAQNCTYDLLTYASDKNGTILIDDSHWSAAADNHMYFNDRYDIVTLDCDDSTRFENTLDTAGYVVCRPGRLALSRSKDDFEAVWPLSSFIYYNKVFYKRKSH